MRGKVLISILGMVLFQRLALTQDFVGEALAAAVKRGYSQRVQLLAFNVSNEYSRDAFISGIHTSRTFEGLALAIQVSNQYSRDEFVAEINRGASSDRLRAAISSGNQRYLYTLKLEEEKKTLERKAQVEKTIGAPFGDATDYLNKLTMEFPSKLFEEHFEKISGRFFELAPTFPEINRFRGVVKDPSKLNSFDDEVLHRFGDHSLLKEYAFFDSGLSPGGWISLFKQAQNKSSIGRVLRESPPTFYIHSSDGTVAITPQFEIENYIFANLSLDPTTDKTKFFRLKTTELFLSKEEAEKNPVLVKHGFEVKASDSPFSSDEVVYEYILQNAEIFDPEQIRSITKQVKNNDLRDKALLHYAKIKIKDESATTALALAEAIKSEGVKDEVLGLFIKTHPLLEIEELEEIKKHAKGNPLREDIQKVIARIENLVPQFIENNKTAGQYLENIALHFNQNRLLRFYEKLKEGFFALSPSIHELNGFREVYRGINPSEKTDRFDEEVFIYGEKSPDLKDYAFFKSVLSPQRWVSLLNLGKPQITTILRELRPTFFMKDPGGVQPVVPLAYVQDQILCAKVSSKLEALPSYLEVFYVPSSELFTEEKDAGRATLSGWYSLSILARNTDPIHITEQFQNLNQYDRFQTEINVTPPYADQRFMLKTKKGNLPIVLFSRDPKKLTATFMLKSEFESVARFRNQAQIYEAPVSLIYFVRSLEEYEEGTSSASLTELPKPTLMDRFLSTRLFKRPKPPKIIDSILLSKTERVLATEGAANSSLLKDRIIQLLSERKELLSLPIKTRALGVSSVENPIGNRVKPNCLQALEGVTGI